MGTSNGGRRTTLAVEVERRLRERAAHLGSRIRAMRTRRRWTQRELGRRAELGRLVIGRLERAEGVLDANRLERVAFAFGVPLAVSFDRDPADEVPAAGHLEMQEIVLRHARSAGWDRGFELPTRPADPWHSADVALSSDRHQVAIDAECWNTFGDIGGAVRSGRRKLVELAALAVARWGSAGTAALVWVVRDTERNRQVMRRYPEVFSTHFTGPSRAWVETLTKGAPPPSGPGLVWCETSTGRLRAWNRPGMRSS